MNRTTEQEVYELLKKLGVSFQKVDHPTITSVKNIPFSLPDPQIKNPLLKSRRGKQTYPVILSDEKHADLKQLAEQLKGKRSSFVSEGQLPDLLGVPAGTVTPLTLMHDKEKEIQVVIGAATDRRDTVGFRPSIGTIMSVMDFSDFEKILVYLEHLPVYENL